MYKKSGGTHFKLTTLHSFSLQKCGMLPMEHCPEVHALGPEPPLVTRWPALRFLEQR